MFGSRDSEIPLAIDQSQILAEEDAQMEIHQVLHPEPGH